MKLSAQEEYGLRCLLRLGREGEGASLTISELSRREGISKTFSLWNVATQSVHVLPDTYN